MLWTTAVDYLFGLLGEALVGVLPADVETVDLLELRSSFAEGIRRFVRFAAEHPELNQIMIHEGTTPSDRLTWMTETHIRPLFGVIRQVWQRLRDAGVTAPIDGDILYYVLVGAASLPYANAAEVRLLTGEDPSSTEWMEAHSDGIVAILLPRSIDQTT